MLFPETTMCWSIPADLARPSWLPLRPLPKCSACDQEHRRSTRRRCRQRRMPPWRRRSRPRQVGLHRALLFVGASMCASAGAPYCSAFCTVWRPHSPPPLHCAGPGAAPGSRRPARAAAAGAAAAAKAAAEAAGTPVQRRPSSILGRTSSTGGSLSSALPPLTPGDEGVAPQAVFSG